LDWAKAEAPLSSVSARAARPARLKEIIVMSSTPFDDTVVSHCLHC
jgi:hypothetical protein